MRKIVSIKETILVLFIALISIIYNNIILLSDKDFLFEF